MIHTKRVYEAASKQDGKRFLIDRVWPRGLRKDSARIEAWLKDVAPSTVLRQWFDHDPRRWAEFRRRYLSELDATPESWRPLLEAAQQGDVTLVYAARDMEHNNAAVLKAYLDEKAHRPGKRA